MKKDTEMQEKQQEIPGTPGPDLSYLAEPAKKTSPPEILLSPEAQAYMNTAISTSVREVFQSVMPLIEKFAMTPEKIAEAEALRRAPDPALVAREKRERELTRQEAEENRQNLLRRQAACAHKYPTGQTSCSAIRNFPDRQPRFVCMLCAAWFSPKRWEIGPPDAENPRGRAYIAPETPGYREIGQAVLSKDGGIS